MEQHPQLLLIAVVLVNLWHGYLLLVTRSNRQQTISEHALACRQLLTLHKLVHYLLSIALLIYAKQNRALFGWTVIFLICGAIFDILEVVTLNKNISKSATDLSDPHQLTSWLMSISYLLFVIFAGLRTKLNLAIILTLIILYLALFLVGIRLKFKNIWAIQMVYFVLLSVNFMLLSLHI